MYTKKHEAKRVDQIIWRCVKPDPPARWLALRKTTKTFDDHEVVKEHNHIADETAVTVAKCRDSMKQRAATTLDKPNQILNFGQPPIPDEAKAMLPSADTCKRVLRRVHAEHRPRDPQSLQELSIEGLWSMTAGHNPARFLLYDNGTDADELVIIFASEDHNMV